MRGGKFTEDDLKEAKDNGAILSEEEESTVRFYNDLFLSVRKKDKISKLSALKAFNLLQNGSMKIENAVSS